MAGAERLVGPSMFAVVDEMSGPALWRCLQPFTALERAGYPCGWAPKDDRLLGAVARHFDGYVLSRVAWPIEHRPAADAWFGMLRAAGKLVVYDTDDDLFTDALLPHLVGAGLDDASASRLDERRRQATWALRQCDGATVSTSRLGEIVRSLTDRPVVVVPNAIDLPWFRAVSRQGRRPWQATTIGWIGGKRADDDVLPMAIAWGRIAERFPSVRFVVGGYRPPVIAAHVPADRLCFLPWRPLERYPELYHGLDIGCAPVAATPFNLSKSDFKVQEYAAARCCVVASPLLYAGLVEHGTTGYLAATADEWEAALVELVERPALRAMMARRLARVVERRCSLAENLARWPSAWQQIAEARHGRIDKLA